MQKTHSPPHNPLPDFVRLSWVSDAAQTLWVEHLVRIRDIWPHVAMQYCRETADHCALLTLPSWQVFPLQAAARQANIGFVVLGVRGQAIPAYAQADQTPASGKAFNYDVAFGQAELLAKIARHWERGDFAAAYQRAGYSACCLEFFHANRNQYRIDPLWQISGGTSTESLLSRQIPSGGLAYPFWRWLQLEPIRLLPCSFTCAAMQALHTEWLSVAKTFGYREEIAWLNEIYNWPVEWTSLHGIAEVRTPIVKLCGTSDAFDEKHTLQLFGAAYPEVGAAGVSFPYRQKSPRARLRQEFRSNIQRLI
jgi:hypothetical protein